MWKKEPMQQNASSLLDAPPPADLSMSTMTKPLDSAAANTVVGGGMKKAQQQRMSGAAVMTPPPMAVPAPALAPVLGRRC